MWNAGGTTAKALRQAQSTHAHRILYSATRICTLLTCHFGSSSQPCVSLGWCASWPAWTQNRVVGKLGADNRIIEGKEGERSCGTITNQCNARLFFFLCCPRLPSRGRTRTTRLRQVRHREWRDTARRFTLHLVHTMEHTYAGSDPHLVFAHARQIAARTFISTPVVVRQAF